MQTVDSIIADILRREAGEVDNPADGGGATNHGVSLRYLRGVGLVRGDLDHDGDIDKDDIHLVDEATAAKFFKTDFFYGPRIDQFPPELHAFLFDCAVNHGPPRAIMFAQRNAREILNQQVEVDGVMGPQTKKYVRLAIEAKGLVYFNNALVGLRKGFFRSIVLERPSQMTFLKGWLKRADEFLM